MTFMSSDRIIGNNFAYTNLEFFGIIFMDYNVKVKEFILICTKRKKTVSSDH